MRQPRSGSRGALQTSLPGDPCGSHPRPYSQGTSVAMLVTPISQTQKPRLRTAKAVAPRQTAQWGGARPPAPGACTPFAPLPSRPVPCHRPHQRLRPGTRLTSHPAGQGGKNSSPRWGPAVGLCPADLPPLALDLPGITSRGGLALSPPPGAGLRPPSLSSDSPPAHRSPYRPEVKPISSPRGPEGGCPAPEASLPLTIFSLAHWTEAAW